MEIIKFESLDILKQFILISNIDFNELFTKDSFNKDLLDKFKIKLEYTNSKIALKQNVIDKLLNDKSIFENDFEFARVFYENFQITPNQASNNLLWNSLNLFELYPYVYHKWDLSMIEKSKHKSHIINHWIQTTSSQSTQMDYPLSGLWWAIHISIDNENTIDKYHLSKIFFKNLNMRTKSLGQSKFARHKPALHAVLEFIIENKLESSIEPSLNAIIPYINILGGIRPLSYYKKEWFKDKLEKKFSEIIKKGKPLSTRNR